MKLQRVSEKESLTGLQGPNEQKQATEALLDESHHLYATRMKVRLQFLYAALDTYPGQATYVV